MRDHGHHDVELELPVLGRDGDAGVVAHHLEADLIHHLGDRRIHLSRHDRRARLHGGQPNLVEPRARAGCHEAQVARDLAEIDGERAQRAAEAGGVAHALHELDAIRALAERRVPEIARRCSTMSAGYSGSTLTPVPTALPPMPSSRRKLGRHLDALQIAVDGDAIRVELLAEANGHRVLQMRAPALEDVVELGALREQRIAQRTECGCEVACERQRTEPDRRRESRRWWTAPC